MGLYELFDRKDNYETYGIAFDKDNIFEEDGKKFLIMNKENDFIYFIGVEDFMIEGHYQMIQ